VRLDAKMKDLFWGALILLTTLGAVSAQVFSLSRGIFDIYPFLYLFPLIIVVYAYPQRGVLFTLVISWAYIGLTYLEGAFEAKLLAFSTVWFFIFVTIGVVVSSYAEGLRNEEKRFQGIFENSQAGIFTVDLRDRTIREINERCAAILGYSRSDLAGAPLDRIWTEAGQPDAFIGRISREAGIADTEIRLLHRDGVPRWMLLSAGMMPGNTAIFSVVDITRRKEAEAELQRLYSELEQRIQDRTADLRLANEALKGEIGERLRAEEKIRAANRKLSTLSSITRHDILNQVSAIVVYLALIEETVTDREMVEYVKKIQHLTRLIQKQIGFTRDYQEVGADAPLWQSVPVAVRKVAATFEGYRVAVTADVGDLELYADPMFEKVIYNLIDNAIRHGGRVTTITFSCSQAPGGSLTVICQDDGTGIPDRVKESIFRREYYKNTGYGLFLSREILAMTGLSIRENGTYGAGALFEITAPPGTFRFGHSGPKRGSG
jgi:PAS domain S-box-containing protein